MARNDLVHAKDYANMSVDQIKKQLKTSRNQDAKVAGDMQ